MSNQFYEQLKASIWLREGQDCLHPSVHSSKSRVKVWDWSVVCMSFPGVLCFIHSIAGAILGPVTDPESSRVKSWGDAHPVGGSAVSQRGPQFRAWMWAVVSKHQGPQHSAQSLCKALSGGCTLESDNVGLALCLGVVGSQWGPGLHGLRPSGRGGGWAGSRQRPGEALREAPEMFSLRAGWGCEQRADWWLYPDQPSFPVVPPCLARRTEYVFTVLPVRPEC